MAFRYQGEVPGLDSTLTVPSSATASGLLLRPWTEQDIPAMLAAHRDPVMRRWLRHPVTTDEHARRIIDAHRAGRREGTGFTFAIVQSDPEGQSHPEGQSDPDGQSDSNGMAGAVVGSISIRRPDDETASGAVGYWVAAAARGQGIAPRALCVVCEWAFRLPWRRPLERLELIHAVANQASCRVADKAGFSLSAVLPPLLPEFPGDGHLHIRLSDSHQELYVDRASPRD
jgi:RimJ/RimL family protein N-acetyltransferase